MESNVSHEDKAIQYHLEQMDYHLLLSHRLAIKLLYCLPSPSPIWLLPISLSLYFFFSSLSSFLSHLPYSDNMIT